MSRFILKAVCATEEPFKDFLQDQNPGLTSTDPTKLTVFVGDKAKNNANVSILPCSGGLYARQLFTWKSLEGLKDLDRSKLFLDYNNVTVTLSMDLELSTDDSLQYGTAGSTIPTGALAVNLGNKGFQFNASNMLNNDCWGKLVYYEQGGLGIGWAFDANTYLPRTGHSVLQGLGMYMTGGLLPDVSYESLANQTDPTQASMVPSYNFQVGRDQALLTQMLSVGNYQGPQGYWSVQPVNLEPTNSFAGRVGGALVTTSETLTPAFMSYNPYTFMSVSYPTALQKDEQKSHSVGWNLLFPSYGPSTQDGYMLPGNALSISPGSFFTDQGLALLKNPAGMPSGPTVTPSNWYTYWDNATSNVHLEETRPFYVEAPIFNAPIAMNLIPNFSSGLCMLVPITRICNGVYIYTPIINGSGDVQAINMNTKQLSGDANYFQNPIGTLQKWFKPKRVSLTINMPFIMVDTAIQASRFFGTPYLDLNYSVNVPLWLKFRFRPTQGVGGLPVNPLDVDTTASLQQIIGASPGGVMELTFTAKQLLERFSSVLATHNVPKSTKWGLSVLEISRVMVSCTTVLDFPRLYRYLFNLNSFKTSPQGAILMNGGTKVFSRCGPSISAGAPTNMNVSFYDVEGEQIGLINQEGIREAYFDIGNVLHGNYGMSNDDYFNSTSEFVFSRSVYLRTPDESSATDSGGQLTVSFTPRPVLNMPFSGEVAKNPLIGGPQFTNSSITQGTLTTTNLASYASGWFNNLNPYCQDYNTKYAVSNIGGTDDTYPFLDYKMVDFTRRKIEVWIQINVPVQIYTGTPFS